MTIISFTYHSSIPDHRNFSCYDKVKKNVCVYIYMYILFISDLTETAISFVSIFANKAYDCTKFVMIYKIVAIPWFIGNFIMGILLIAGMLNPFLLLAIPIVIMLLILSTYICMVSSSTINFSHIVVLAKNNGLSLNVPFMIGIIISFIFCLDVVGAILIFLENSTNA